MIPFYVHLSTLFTSFSPLFSSPFLSFLPLLPSPRLCSDLSLLELCLSSPPASALTLILMHLKGEDNAGGFDQWVQQQQQQQQPQQKETSSAWGEIFTTQSTGQEEEEAEGEGRDLQLPHQESGTEELGANKEDMEEERNGEDRKTGSDSDDKSSEGDSEDASEAESWEGEDVQFCEICTRIKAIVSCVECGCVLCGQCSNEIHRQTISKHSVMIHMEMEVEMGMEMIVVIMMMCIMMTPLMITETFDLFASRANFSHFQHCF